MGTADVHRITACETYRMTAESPGSCLSWISTSVGQTVLQQLAQLHMKTRGYPVAVVRIGVGISSGV